MTWKPYDPATLDLAGAEVFVEAGTPSTHSVDALRDPARFTPA